MSFEPIKSKLRERRIITYDLEWIPETMQFSLGGIYDGQNYLYETNISSFCRTLFQPKHEGAWIYAHAGGMADIMFILDEVSKHRDVQVEATFSGSSAIHVTVKWARHRWVLLDSYWLLRDKLAHLAHSVGMTKTRGSYKCANYPACGHLGRECASAPACGCDVGPEPLCMFYAPTAVLKDYNEIDNRILWTAITRFQDELLTMGSDLQVTIASTAMRLFRRKYLQRPIQTSPALSDRTRPAYVASRVEPYRSECKDELKEYDINSSFPYAMTKETPGSLLGTRRTLPSVGPYFAQARISIPDMFLPPLGRRAQRDGRIYFPVGTWEGLFSRPDLELLEEAGGRIEKVFECHVFESRDDFAMYATELYNQRKASKDPFVKILLKYLLNSCYGKTAESREKRRLVLHPDSEGCPHGGEHDIIDGQVMRASCVEVLFPGAILVTEEREIAHEHVPIAAQITSEARRTLWHCARPCGEDLYYSDTDSLYTHQELPTGNELGQLKLERTVPPPSLFVAPKLYLAGGKVKSKGFSRLSEEAFRGLIGGHPVELERMMRVREMARSKGFLGPLIQKLTKSLSLDSHRPKRKMKDDRPSEPWNVLQIEERWKPETDRHLSRGHV